MKNTNQDAENARKKAAYDAERKTRKIDALAKAYGAKIGREAKADALRSIEKELLLGERYGRPVRSIIIGLKEIKPEDAERLKAEFNKASPMTDFNRDARTWLGDYSNHAGDAFRYSVASIFNGKPATPKVRKMRDPLLIGFIVLMWLQIAFAFAIMFMQLWK